MQFLLLLSALLSAVTGAFAAPRAESAPVDRVEARQVVAAPAAIPAIAAASRPGLVRPAQSGNAGLRVAETPAPILPAPLTSVRRTE